MTVRSPAKVKVKQIQQVCIVCNDVQKTMEAYWNILGIGPWAVFEFGSLRIPDLCYYGKPAWGRYKGAVTQVGPIELELFETLEGASVYQDWIDEHGEGLHHMKFLVEDLDIDRVNREMEKLGFPRIKGGHFGPDTGIIVHILDSFQSLFTKPAQGPAVDTQLPGNMGRRSRKDPIFAPVRRKQLRNQRDRTNHC